MREQYERYVELITQGLTEYLPHSQVAQVKLLDAMTYSAFAPGKRIRPVLTLAFCDALGGKPSWALPFACAVEMIHTYSLIHDDLPCMDDDDTRRGLPTNHRMFGEATALLAGDALLSAAFETVLDKDYVKDIPAERVIAAAHRLAWASGAYGMAGGQLLDLDAEFLEQNVESAAQICLLKTAALIDAASVVGCELAGGNQEQLAAASSYARCLGLAFQMKDDLLNLEGDPAQMGKASGTDEASGKLTFASLLGKEECRRLIVSLSDCAKAYLDPIPNNEFLVWLVNMLTDRER